MGTSYSFLEDAGLVNELNAVFLVTLSNEECRLTFGNQITDNMVCASGNYNEGICTVGLYYRFVKRWR